ncbi:MAG: 16S rRNA (cytidine(1402)-2'-O)-methyltransferase [Crocinitomicaceae bacterium]|nr:16S rRNA (cytidine(1402)-2'-O)-methyltransferase [Crocinitomicaceae bacterium]
MSRLIITPTPIGNLEDITLRAIRHLKECDFILAEDTRVTRKLLNHLEISKSVFSFHSHNEHRVLNLVIQKIQEAENVVLVSDAGTPGISDPGFLLIRSCIENDIEIECLPGPTAVIPALVVSGFPTDRFIFEGFLAHKKGRQTRIKEICSETRTTVLYESPHRINKMLKQFQEFIHPDRQIAVIREISKMFEEVKRGNIQELIDFSETKELKGEIVVVVSAI